MGHYFHNAVLLTGSGLLLRAAGMIFRVVIAAQIGAQGMGLYQLVFTVYNISISLATAGLGIAATRLTAQLENQGKSSAPGVARLCTLALRLGLTACGLQMALAYPAAKYWLGDTRITLSLLVLAPSLPFMSLAGVWRGYFLAKGRVEPGIISQLIEQAIRLGLAFWMLGLTLPYGAELTCAGLTLASTLSEGVSCLIVGLWYRAKVCPSPAEKTHDRQIWGILLPIQCDRLLASGLHGVENALIPACLTIHLADRQEALGQYGALKGMAIPVVFFPFSFLAALSTLLMPQITAAFTRRDYPAIGRQIHKTMVLTTSVSFLAAGLCTVCGESVGQLLYHDRQVGLYLAAMGPILPFMYVESMIDGILNGLGEQLAGLRYSLVDSVLRIGCVILLVPRYGVQGFLWMMAVSNGLSCYLNVHRMLKAGHTPMRWWRWVGCPMACLGIAHWAGQLAGQQLCPVTDWQWLAVYGGVITAVYLPLVWVFAVGKALRDDAPRKAHTQ